MSLDLDTRQRAMLDEMGVKVWWPGGAEVPARAVNPVPASVSILAAEARQGTAAFAPPAALPSGSAAHLDWPALQQAVAGCQACGLCATRKNTVFGVGQAPVAPDSAPQVDWLVVGEAPGENEDLQGEPFVGAAGKLLDNMLKAMGCNRHQNVYIANVLKCRPPDNRNPAPEEIAQCAPYLHRQVALLRPKIILAMGRFAVQALLADSVPDVATIPLGKLRGKVYAYHGVPVVVTYHPAYLLRSLADKAKAWADLCLGLAVVAQAQADDAGRMS